MQKKIHNPKNDLATVINNLKSNSTLFIPAGEYFFNTALKAKNIPISNTTTITELPQNKRQFHLFLQNKKNIHLIGLGEVKFIFTANASLIGLARVNNFTLKNICLINYQHACQTYFIKDITAKKLSLVPLKKISCTNKKLHYNNDPALEVSANCWLASSTCIKKNNFLKRYYSPLLTHECKVAFSAQELKITYPNKTPTNLIVGDEINLSPYFRQKVGLFINQSQHINLLNCAIKNNNTHAIIAQNSANITINKYHQLADDNHLSSVCDIIHLSECRGKVNILNSHLGYADDDAINVHGIYYQIKTINRKNIFITFLHAQAHGFLAFKPGDKINILTKKLKIIATARIKEARLLRDEKTIILRLNKKIMPDYLNLYIQNNNNNPKVIIKNNHFTNISTRGILVTSNQKVLIKNNTFAPLGMASIFISNDILNWYEAGATKKVIITNNKFTQDISPALLVKPISEGEYLTHDLIVLKNNTFHFTTNLVDAIQIKKIIMQNNVFNKEPFAYIKSDNLVICKNNKIQK